jgi:hypothetical protein
MSRKCSLSWIVFIGLAALLLPWTAPAHAQEPTPENDANCVACHEHQYYVFDSGKWFCLCDAPMHCVYCHSGRTDGLEKEVAHEGLVLYPTREHAARCQTCHEEDYMARVVTFASVAGISSTPRTLITATPVEIAAVPAASRTAPALVHLSQLEPWQLIGLGSLGIALIGTLIFGYYCWKADCLVKRQS